MFRLSIATSQYVGFNFKLKPINVKVVMDRIEIKYNLIPAIKTL